MTGTSLGRTRRSWSKSAEVGVKLCDTCTGSAFPNSGRSTLTLTAHRPWDANVVRRPLLQLGTLLPRPDRRWGHLRLPAQLARSRARAPFRLHCELSVLGVRLHACGHTPACQEGSQRPPSRRGDVLVCQLTHPRPVLSVFHRPDRKRLEPGPGGMLPAVLTARR